MCLAIPVKVVWIGREGEGEVELKGVRKKVNLSLTPRVKKGDWVLLHAGFSIQIISKEEAEETLRLWEEIGEMGRNS